MSVNRFGLCRAALEQEFKSWMAVRLSIMLAAEQYPFSSPEHQRFRAVVDAMEEAIKAEGFSILAMMGAYEGPERIARARRP